jgi:hypothetical protein
MSVLARLIHLHPIRLGNHLERFPSVSGLAAALLLMALAQTLRRWFIVSIAGRGVAAVAAILRYLIFQRLNPPYELNDCLVHAAE